MLRARVLVVIILLPIGIFLIYLGGAPFSLFVTLILSLAAWEYTRLFRAAGQQPSGPLIIGGVALLALGRAWDSRFSTPDGFTSAPVLISVAVLAAMSYHLIAYERGRDQAATDFGVTLAGIIYIGWLGAYLISLRDLPEGFWLFLLVLPGVWLADSGAYFIGRAFGRHRLSPRLSPKKTWEGYLAGVLIGISGTAGLVHLWGTWAGPGFTITPLQGALLGLLLSTLPTLGDLGESLIKRQAGVKDSGNLLPGHGGVFDRIDSWLWGALIGYYFIRWVVL